MSYFLPYIHGKNKQKLNQIGIGFDFRSEFSILEGSVGKDVINFRVDMRLSLYIDNKSKDGKGPTQELDVNSRS